MRVSLKELLTPRLLGDSPVVCLYWLFHGFSQQTFTADVTEITAYSRTAAGPWN